MAKARSPINAVQISSRNLLFVDCFPDFFLDFFFTTFSRVYQYFPDDFGRLFFTADHIAETLGRGGN